MRIAKQQENQDQQNKDQQNKDQENKDQKNKDQKNKDQEDQENQNQENKDQKEKGEKDKSKEKQQPKENNRILPSSQPGLWKWSRALRFCFPVGFHTQISRFDALAEFLFISPRDGCRSGVAISLFSQHLKMSRLSVFTLMADILDTCWWFAVCSIPVYFSQGQYHTTKVAV